MKDNLDTLIDNLLKARPIDASASFADAALSRLHETGGLAEKDSRDMLDTRIDTLLARHPVEASANFTRDTLARIRRSKLWNHALSLVAGVSVAACAIFATVAAIETTPISQPSRSALADYAQMTEISDEISAIKVLIVQEEFLDYMHF